MNWTLYWFMLPVCIVIASVAMFSGISGAALLIPVFLIAFPLLGLPRLATVAAVGTSLLLEASGFGTGVVRYVRMKLVDTVTAKRIIRVTLPLGAIGAIASAYAPVNLLRLGYGAAMLGLAWMLFSDTDGRAGDLPAPAVVAESEDTHASCGLGEARTVTAASGVTYEYCAHGLSLQQVMSGAGAFVAGLISTGVGEATLPPLVRRSKFPVPVAAATSTVIVAGTVVGAAVTHLIQLTAEGGLSAIPWDLIVWSVPGSMIGAVVGTRFQGKVSEQTTRRIFSTLFALIGATFLLAFTVFRSRFA